MKYWIDVVSKDHVQIGLQNSIIQACHGKRFPLANVKKGDKVIFYSPKESFTGKNPLQAFTAVGTIRNDEIYQFPMSENFIPRRKDIDFEDCREVGIRPIIDELDFITDKTHWGYKFRLGLFEISQSDFFKIYSLMKEQDE